MTRITKVNFTGAGVTATRRGSTIDVNVLPQHTITQDEGAPLAARTYLDFTGTLVVATDDSANDRTKITVSPQIIVVKDSGILTTNTAAQNDAAMTAAVTAATAGSVFIFLAGTYSFNAISITKKLHFIGFMTTIQSGSTAGDLISISASGTTFSGFKIIGNGIAGAAINGIKTSGANNMQFFNLYFSDFNGQGLYIQSTGGHVASTVVECNFSTCVIGYLTNTSGEYVNFTSCSFNANTTGVHVRSGNNTFTNCIITDNGTGVSCREGTNDSHGRFSNCQINHNTTVNIFCASYLNGFFFDNCNIYGGDIQCVDDLYTHFKNCTFGGSVTFYFDNSTGAIIEGSNIMDSTVDINTAWNSHPSTVLMWDNYYIDNTLYTKLNYDQPDQYISLTSTYSLTSQTALQKMFNSTTNGALTVLGLKTYFFECEFDLSSMSGSSGDFSFGFGGTATLTSVKYTSHAAKAAIGTPTAALVVTYAVATAGSLVAANTTTTGHAKISGIIRVNAGGTLIPQVGLGVAAVAVVGINSWFRLTPVGSNTLVKRGNWN